MEITIQVYNDGKMVAYDNRNSKTYAIEKLQYLASKGDTLAECAMGDDKAMPWYRKAAEKGNAKAQWCLGCGYFQGLGIEKDLKQAEYWFSKSAEQGNMPSFGLKKLLRRGTNLRRNH